MARTTKTEYWNKQFIENLRKYGEAEFSIEWRKSSMGTTNPAVVWRGHRIAYASGGNYDTESAALAQTFNSLVPANHHPLPGGAGFNSVQADLMNLGWKLGRLYRGRREDGFSITRLGETAPDQAEINKPSAFSTFFGSAINTLKGRKKEMNHG